MKDSVDQLVEVIEFPATIDSFSALAESPYALISSNSKIYLASLKELTKQEIVLEKEYVKVLSLLCHPEISLENLFIISSKAEIDVWDLDLSTNKVKLCKSIKVSSMTMLSWNKATKKILAAAGTNPEFLLWNLEKGTETCRKIKTETIVTLMCWLKPQSNLLAITQTNRIVIYNTETEEKYFTITDISEPIASIDSVYNVLLYSYADTIVRFNVNKKIQEAKAFCLSPIIFIKSDQYDDKIYYCTKGFIYRGEFQQAKEWSLVPSRVFHLEPKAAIELAYSSETNSDRVILWKEGNRLVLWEVEGDMELDLVSNRDSEEEEIELMDPFFKEVSRIENELLENVKVIDLDYKKRKLLVKVILNSEIWILLSITIPHLYPTTIAPVISIIRASGFSNVHKKNMTQRIKDLVVRHSLKNTLSVKEAIQLILNEIQDFSKYPSSA